jgi:hypothetical protein
LGFLRRLRKPFYTERINSSPNPDFIFEIFNVNTSTFCSFIRRVWQKNIQSINLVASIKQHLCKKVNLPGILHGKIPFDDAGNLI